MTDPGGPHWKGKVVIVTGGARGVGAATCTHFAQLGAQVVSTDVLAEQGQEHIAQLEAQGLNARFIAGDIASEDHVRALIDSTAQAFGRIDLLVNNAAILTAHDRPEDFSMSELRRVVEIDLLGPLMATHLAAPIMARGGGGNVVNIASTGAIMEIPVSPVYSAAKAGILGFTRSMAAALAPSKVRVNALAPSLIDTAMTAGSELHTRKAAMQPADIARAIDCVASQLDVSGAFFTVRNTPSGVRLSRLVDPPEELMLDMVV